MAGGHDLFVALAQRSPKQNGDEENGMDDLQDRYLPVISRIGLT
jgi:hypothetical protein